MANDMFAGGLRADYIRKQLETKNTLTSKGALYVGLGTKTYSSDLSQAVDTDGNKNIYQTTALPAGDNNYVLIADSTTTTGLRYGLIGDSNIDSISGNKLKNDINAEKITSGILDISRIPNMSADKITSGSFNAARIPNLDATKITTGELDEARIPTIKFAKLGDNANNLTVGKTKILLGNTASTVEFGNASVTSVKLGENGVASIRYSSLSDKRLKTNIKPYEYKGSILDIPVYTYDYINSGISSMGFIAQDLQKQYPELVYTDEKGYLNICETKLIYLLLEEVKQLKQQINNRG